MTLVSQSTNTVRGGRKKSKDKLHWPSENELKKIRIRVAPGDLVCGVRTLHLVWYGKV